MVLWESDKRKKGDGEETEGNCSQSRKVRESRGIHLGFYAPVNVKPQGGGGGGGLPTGI